MIATSIYNVGDTIAVDDNESATIIEIIARINSENEIEIFYILDNNTYKKEYKNDFLEKVNNFKNTCIH